MTQKPRDPRRLRAQTSKTAAFERRNRRRMRGSTPRPALGLEDAAGRPPEAPATIRARRKKPGLPKLRRPTNVDPGLINCLLIWVCPWFSGDLSLLEGNTPILINRGLLIRGQHYGDIFGGVGALLQVGSSWEVNKAMSLQRASEILTESGRVFHHKQIRKKGRRQM